MATKTPTTSAEVAAKTVNATTKSQVDVTITITETAATTNKTKDAVLKVSGLALSTLELEAKKFTDFTGTAKTSSQTVAQAVATIKADETAEQRLTALKALTDTAIPTVVDGFSFVVTSAAQNATTNTQLDVTITVSQTGNDKTQTAILKIGSFAAPSGSARN